MTEVMEGQKRTPPARNKRKKKGMPFLLGGCKKDPLNLGNILLNCPTPQHEQQLLEIVVPKNTKDPLNLKTATKRKRKRRDSTKTNTEEAADEEEMTSFSDSEVGKKKKKEQMAGTRKERTNTFSTGGARKMGDKIVSPVPPPIKKNRPNCVPSTSITEGENNKKKNNDRFRYGNYNRYYGTRLADKEDDPRLKLIQREYIEKRRVLDIGCNVGYLTLKLARDMAPTNIIGIDIDGGLVGIARKNIRHYCDNNIPMAGKFPASFSRQFGPLSAPSIAESPVFPDNVWFRQENYVMANDQLLETVNEEYDTILALSITKWVHLNWGDEGLKRFFRRIFLQLVPGGVLILEPQPFSTYRKRSKMTPEMQQHFKNAKLKPEDFGEYLVNEVGFLAGNVLPVAESKSKGFQRPLLVFTKPGQHSSSALGELAKTVDVPPPECSMDAVNAAEPPLESPDLVKH